MPDRETTERARVVAWLRAQADLMLQREDAMLARQWQRQADGYWHRGRAYHEAADKIERGVHEHVEENANA